MKTTTYTRIGAFSAAVLAHAVAVATVIDFDTLGGGVQVSNQYPEATFSSKPGSWIITNGFYNLGSSAPYYICSGPIGGSFNCTDPYFVAFTNPVNNLRFLALGSDSTGNVADIVVHHGGGTSTVFIPGTANFFVPIPVDLSAYTSVTQIEIANITDGGGLAFDDFSFDPVPEPATILAVSLGLSGMVLRRRRAKT